jgi:hypothetical protein
VVHGFERYEITGCGVATASSVVDSAEERPAVPVENTATTATDITDRDLIRRGTKHAGLHQRPTGRLGPARTCAPLTAGRTATTPAPLEGRRRGRTHPRRRATARGHRGGPPDPDPEAAISRALGPPTTAVPIAQLQESSGRIRTSRSSTPGPPRARRSTARSGPGTADPTPFEASGPMRTH